MEGQGRFKMVSLHTEHVRYRSRSMKTTAEQRKKVTDENPSSILVEKLPSGSPKLFAYM